MARLSDALLEKGEAYGGSVGRVMNLAHGGQGGHMMALGKIDGNGSYAEEWINNHAYVRRNIIPVVISTPGAFQFMANPEKWVAMFKHLIEVMPLNITGLSSTLTLETDQHPIGGSGEQQDEPTNATYSTSNITFTFKERGLKSITKFLDTYIRYIIMDPNTKKPLVATLVDSIDSFGGAYLPDMYTATVLFIEPDITQLMVVDAWLASNIMLKSAGDRTGSRDVHSPGETVELSIEATNITVNNEAVHLLAENILRGMTTLKRIPDNGIVVPTDISETVKAQATGFNI